MKQQFYLKIIFNLSLFIFVSLNTFSQKKIISTGDNWQYYDDEKTPTAGWEKSDEFTKNWKLGVSPLGYGDSKVKTKIGFGDDPKAKHITKYFKIKFRLDDPYQNLAYSLNLLRDDGAVVYLNGREIMRSNMPIGKITNSTLANSLVVTSEAENNFHKKLLLPDDLISGINTISVSVHKARKTSVDCIFDLEIIAENNPDLLPSLIKERSIKNLTFESKLREINYAQKAENKELQFQLLLQSKNNIKLLFFIASFLFLITLISLYYIWKLLSKKIHKLKLKTAELKTSNQNKHKEMMSFSIKSLNNQQYLKGLKKELELNLEDNLASSRKGIKKIINQIEFNLEVNEDFENLKKHFNAVHLGYYDKIIALHPSLSEVELRHCIFIKLFMQTKEIANILHIDPKSVQASRYRIKKKMKLDENTDLRDYLLSI
mgnify:CR=1 FL=1